MGRCPSSAVWLLLLAAGPLLAADEPARVALPGESAGTGRRLAAADKLAADKQYAAAAEEYVHIIDEAGDDLVAVDRHLIIPARHLCQVRLAALPADVLKSYRDHLDPQAKKWLDQGTADRDMRPLQRLVEEAFLSRHTDTALDRLGDLEFERGRFAEAQRWWRRIALPASEAALRLKHPVPPPWSKSEGRAPSVEWPYPDPQIDVAGVRAKQLLALLFRGEQEAAKEELTAFRAAHPKAEGHLAGRQGNYADILQTIAGRPILAESTDDAWTTFGGSPSRGAVLPPVKDDANRLMRLVEQGPTWWFRLDKRTPVERERGVPPAGSARALAFHPVILDRQVVVADARSVTAFDTTTRTKQTWELGKDQGRGINPDNKLPAPDDLRYTLTVDEGRIYARLGVQELPPTKPETVAASYLVCLEFSGRSRELKALWVREAEPPAKGPTPIFEGTPVVRDGSLYVAVTRFDGAQMTSEVRCYSTESDAPPRWKQDVVATRDQPAGGRYRHQLLTLAGRHVIYATHAGTVVALDAHSGRRAWAYCYPSAFVRNSAGAPVPRDLAPAVYAEGRVYVAPADYDRLLCLDAETGELLWERERVEVVHLLGVGSGRLIFATPKGLRAVGAADGSDGSGWVLPDSSGYEGLPSYGRGFLAGGCVFWPTIRGVEVVDQVTGRPPITLIPGPLGLHNLAPGNMAYADGLLAVADRTDLRIYVGEKNRPERPAPRPERSGQALNELATRASAFARQGRPADALAAWQQVLTDDGLRRQTLHDAGQRPQQAALVAAERIDELIRAHGRPLYASTEDRARAALTAAKGDTGALERLAEDYPNAAAAGPALLQLAKVSEESGRWGAAAQAYRRLLRRPASEEDRKTALAGLDRAAAQERTRFTVPNEPSDSAGPLERCWEKDERLLPLVEELPGRDSLLVRGLLSPRPGTPGRGVGGEGLGSSPLTPDPSPRSTGARGVLVCRDVGSGAERWSRPIATAPMWAGRHAAIAVVAGPKAVQAFALFDGTPLWQFPAPDSMTFVDPRLSAFQMAGGRFFCLQGECRLLALDVESGRVLWQNWAPVARLTADVPGTHFSPHYLATANRVVIQSAGRCRILAAEDGALVDALPTDILLWPQAPVLLGKERVALIARRETVAGLDLSHGKVAWSHTLRGSTTLTGEPPLLIGDGNALLVIASRNYGYTLRRLDPETGRPVWGEEVQLGADRVGPACFAVDRGSVYYSSRNVVTALALDDGRVLWEETLPGPRGDWRLDRVGSALLAWPAQARRTKLHSHWLTASLELDVILPPSDRVGSSIPLLLLDASNGRPFQRLNFVPPLPRAQERLALNEELIAMPKVFCESIGAAGPIVTQMGKGLVVGWDNKVWALRPEK